MDGVPGERHPGLGAEAYQRPGLTTELRRIGSTRRSGLECEPRDRDHAGFDAELSDVPIEHARGSDEPASDRAHRPFHAGADTKGPDCADDRTERALDAEAGVDPVLGEGHERRDGQRALRTCGRGAPQRKSTRLNSSHLVSSYAVFCLKKKTRTCGGARPPEESRACPQ